MEAIMSILDAEKAFKAAAKDLQQPDDRALWNMNAGFLHLCSALRTMERDIAQIDRMIGHVSRQIAEQ
jgi:hypothetical protein